MRLGSYDVPFDEYRSWPFVNNSSLGKLRRSPAHYAADTHTEEVSDALRFGRFLHDFQSDPASITKFYVIEPDFTHDIDSKNPKATKKYKERVASFRESVGDKEIVSTAWFEATQAMLVSLRQCEDAKRFLCHDGPAEISLVWDEPTTGVRCKSRFDKWDRSNRIITDIKSTQDCTDFNRAIGRYRYHRQAAFYVDAAEAVTGEPHQFAFVAVDKEPPFAVRAALLDEDSIESGRHEYRRLLALLQECRESDQWPGPPSPEHFTCPEWARDETSEPIELVIGGMTVSI